MGHIQKKEKPSVLSSIMISYEFSLSTWGYERLEMVIIFTLAQGHINFPRQSGHLQLIQIPKISTSLVSTNYF